MFGNSGLLSVSEAQVYLLTHTHTIYAFMHTHTHIYIYIYIHTDTGAYYGLEIDNHTWSCTVIVIYSQRDLQTVLCSYYFLYFSHDHL